MSKYSRRKIDPETLRDYDNITPPKPKNVEVEDNKIPPSLKRVRITWRHYLKHPQLLLIRKKEDKMQYIIERLREPTTWAGLAIILSLFGINLDADVIAEGIDDIVTSVSVIVAAASAIYISIFKEKKDPEPPVDPNNTK